MELKDFWIFSKQNYFPNLDFDIEKGSLSVLLGAKNNFCEINKISGFFQKEFSFPDFHTCEDQGFLDFFLFSEIFKLPHNGIQGFLDFFKKNCFPDFHTCEDQGFLDFFIS